MTLGITIGRSIAALRRLIRNDQFSLLVLAVAIGVAAAYCAIGFRELYLLGQMTSFGIRSDTLFSHSTKAGSDVGD